MCRHNPILTDGATRQKLTEWRSFARGNGLVFEGNGIEYSIINYAVSGSPRVVKKLRKIKLRRKH